MGTTNRSAGLSQHGRRANHRRGSASSYSSSSISTRASDRTNSISSRSSSPAVVDADELIARQFIEGEPSLQSAAKLDRNAVGSRFRRGSRVSHPQQHHPHSGTSEVQTGIRHRPTRTCKDCLLSPRLSSSMYRRITSCRSAVSQTDPEFLHVCTAMLAEHKSLKPPCNDLMDLDSVLGEMSKNASSDLALFIGSHGQKMMAQQG